MGLVGRGSQRGSERGKIHPEAGPHRGSVPHLLLQTFRCGVLAWSGYAEFWRWRIYVGHGFDGQPVAVLPPAQHLTLVRRDEPWTQHNVTYRPDKHRLETVASEHLLETARQSPQSSLPIESQNECRPVTAGKRRLVAAHPDPR